MFDIKYFSFAELNTIPMVEDFDEIILKANDSPDKRKVFLRDNTITTPVEVTIEGKLVTKNQKTLMDFII